MNIKKTIQIALSSVLLIITLLSNTAFAQVPEQKVDINDLLYKYTSDFTTEVTTTDYVASLPEEETPGDILGQLIYFSLVIANVLALISFIIAGVFMVASQGNEDDNSKAKKILTYTIIALIICATALALVTGVTKLNFFSP